MELRAWTDSVVSELGDAPDKAAPIREATILGYDGRKHAVALVAGKVMKIDIRHLYVRQPPPEKAQPAVAPPPPPRQGPLVELDSAYVRIKTAGAYARPAIRRRAYNAS
jgi:hypothetical protein